MRSQELLIALGALVLIVVALWLSRWMSAGAPVVPRQELGPPIESAANGPEGAEASLSGAASTIVEAVPGAIREVAPAHDVVVLLAVEKASGAPVPGADVWYGSQSLLREHGARGPSDAEEILRRIGRHARTDERGEVRLPAAESSRAVLRRGELAAVQDFHQGHAGSSVRVELELQRSIAIQVVDRQGRPVAGVQVAIETRDPEWPHERGRELWNGTTRGEAGLAVLHQFDALRIGRYAGGDVVDHARGKWLVALLPFPLAEPVEVGFHPEELPSEPVQLVLPATGSLRIDLLDPDGEPFTEDAWVYASLPIERLGQAPEWRRRGAWYARGGSQLVPHVGLGLALRLEADHRSHEDAQLDVAGPQAEGEERRCVLQFPARKFALVGRALDLEGEPLVKRRLRLLLDADNGPRGREKISADGDTDAEGRFRLIPRHLNGDALLHGLRLATDPQAESEVLAAELELGRKFAGEGEIDLGELRLSPAPIAVSGRIVDSEGAPIYWAMIDVFHDEQTGEGVDLSTRRSYDYGLRAYSRTDGTFEIHGELEPRPWHIEVKKSPYVPSAPIPIRQGERGLEVMLRRTGALEGSVLVDAGVPPGLLELELRREGQAPRTRWREGTHTPLPNGSFRIGELEPGVYDLFLHLDLENGPVHALNGILVEADGTSADPRLAAIDLRGRLFAFRFEVVGEGGEPAHPALLAFRPAQEEEDMRRRVILEQGAGLFVSPWPWIDVEVRAHGWRPEWLEEIAAGARVRLSRGIEVRFRLPDDMELPPEPLALRLALIPERIYRKPGEPDHTYTSDGRDRNWRVQWDRELAGVFGRSRELTLLLPEAGRYEFEWTLLTDSASASPSKTRHPATIEISAAPSSSAFDLGPDPESLRAAVLQLVGAEAR